MKQMAERPNVSCKLSGINEVAGRGKEVAQIADQGELGLGDAKYVAFAGREVNLYPGAYDYGPYLGSGMDTVIVSSSGDMLRAPGASVGCSSVWAEAQGKEGDDVMVNFAGSSLDQPDGILSLQFAGKGFRVDLHLV